MTPLEAATGAFPDPVEADYDPIGSEDGEHRYRNAVLKVTYQREGLMKVLPLLVECREYVKEAPHSNYCRESGLICTCGRDALLSQLNALLTPTNDQR